MTPSPTAERLPETASTTPRNCGSSTVAESERTITISFVGSGPRRWSLSRFSARCDSGLFVSDTSVVKAPDSSKPIAAIEATITATQIPTTVQGRRAETRARCSVDSIDNAIFWVLLHFVRTAPPPPSNATYRVSSDRLLAGGWRLQLRLRPYRYSGA